MIRTTEPLKTDTKSGLLDRNMAQHLQVGGIGCAVLVQTVFSDDQDGVEVRNVDGIVSWRGIIGVKLCDIGLIGNVQYFEAKFSITEVQVVALNAQSMRMFHGIGAHQTGLVDVADVNYIQLVDKATATVATAQSDISKVAIYINWIASHFVAELTDKCRRQWVAVVIDEHAVGATDEQMIAIRENGLNAPAGTDHQIAGLKGIFSICDIIDMHVLLVDDVQYLSIDGKTGHRTSNTNGFTASTAYSSTTSGLWASI